MTKTPGKRSPRRGKLQRPHPARREGRFLPFFFLEEDLAVWAGGVAFLREARGGWDDSDLPEKHPKAHRDECSIVLWAARCHTHR
ncbi:hypothetical protein DPX16_0230 [Anabarilius grahami]|uniref:Uncharacterized protein n=1 Tax=Anabarilius grahami TaxID=495550 RepID=A0A3N0Z5B0_ANAGA|nr:hypothetical protein DPX16_0230 [Anabarilius grahami]